MCGLHNSFSKRVLLTALIQSDAVASSIASRLNIPKSDILNPESSTTSSAVKLALAETHIITETKKYLEEQGVDLEAFTRPTTVRSQTTILVKNIPYGTSVDELREAFSSHGRLKRLLMPPAGTIAIVEFAEAKDAGKAYISLAYKRMKNSITYLEKAPEGLFDRAPAIKGKEDRETSASATADPKISEEEQAIVPGSTIHLGNLSFGTTTDRLRSVFHHLPGFLYARVATKADPSKPGVLLSQGFGFVGFKDADSAAKAIKGMRGFVLDGHVLKVNFAGRGQGMEVEKSAKAGEEKGKEHKKTKMVVKNLPFEANKKELWELFRCVFTW
jgi:multiple RNA-binding domain-containing protein 1